MELIREKDLTQHQIVQLRKLESEAQDDCFIGSTVMVPTRRMAMVEQGVVVGFFTPVTTTRKSIKLWRVGLTYVGSKHRNKGYARIALSLFFRIRKGIAWIETTNDHSRALFKSVGFVEAESECDAKGKNGNWFVKLS